MSERFGDGLATADERSSTAWRAEGALFAVDERRDRYDDDQKSIQGAWLRAKDSVEDQFLAGTDRSPIPLDGARLAAYAAELATGHPGYFLQMRPLNSSLAVVRRYWQPFRPFAFDPVWHVNRRRPRGRCTSRGLLRDAHLADALKTRAATTTTS